MHVNPLVLLALAAVPFLFNTGLQVSGYNNTTVTALCWGLAAVILVWAALEYVRGWSRAQIQAGGTGVQTWHFLALGAVGTWLFLTVALAAAGWSIWNGQGLSASFGASRPTVVDDGPLRWADGTLTLEGGPIQNRNVFSIGFRGVNSSQKEVALKDAYIVSAINGTKQTLEIAIQGELLSVDQINLIPPGAPINLIAKFGPPNPAAPGRILGIDVPTFLATWRQFFLNVEDDTRKYRLTFNEAHLQPLFPGMAGPHITKKGQ